MVQKDCPVFTTTAITGIRGHLEQICHKPNNPSHKDHLPRLPSPTPSNLAPFAAQFSSSAKAIRQHLHCQQQHKGQQEEALQPDSPQMLLANDNSKGLRRWKMPMKSKQLYELPKKSLLPHFNRQRQTNKKDSGLHL